MADPLINHERGKKQRFRRTFDAMARLGASHLVSYTMPEDAYSIPGEDLELRIAGIWSSEHPGHLRIEVVDIDGNWGWYAESRILVIVGDTELLAFHPHKIKAVEIHADLAAKLMMKAPVGHSIRLRIRPLPETPNK